MFQGNWKCSSCGGAITELPFEPRSEAGLTCRDCYMKQKDASKSEPTDAPESASEPSSEAPESADIATDMPADTSGEPAQATATAGERKMFTGDWKCAGCGSAITQLPFEPHNTENLKCIDCFKKSKNS